MIEIQNNTDLKIGLALSGGGVRAAAFHAGVLKRLAERELLERVAHISTVSGGSLFTGLVYQAAGYHWPSSYQYIDMVLPTVHRVLTTTSLQYDAFMRLMFNPVNWMLLLSRANVIAKSIEELWGVKATLKQLPTSPIWSINGTTAENGRRFRFKNGEIGDYEVGYAQAPNFKLAAAMAVSAAFPGGIGPLSLSTAGYNWKKRKNWDIGNPAEEVMPRFPRLHLYDGGVYDNLGIEPLFDVGSQSLKNESHPEINYLVVSDAGKPFRRGEIPGPLRLKRLQRVADVAFDQARALRVRSIVNFLKMNKSAGLYLQIGTDPVKCVKQFAEKALIENLVTAYDWLTSKAVSNAMAYKTVLTQMTESDFELLMRHGYETELWNELVFS
jgi:NTE family protein